MLCWEELRTWEIDWAHLLRKGMESRAAYRGQFLSFFSILLLGRSNQPEADGAADGERGSPREEGGRHSGEPSNHTKCATAGQWRYEMGAEGC